MATKLNVERLNDLLQRELYQYPCIVESVGELRASVRHPIGREHLRPGGTVAGPVMMTTADVALFVAILAHIGEIPLTVTTSLNFNFMRKPSANADLLAHARLLKVGKNLAVGDVELYSEGDERMVAHATGTYAIPPRKPNKTP